jgi:hypothetical protein
VTDPIDPRLAVALAKAAGLDTADLERQLDPGQAHARDLAQMLRDDATRRRDRDATLLGLPIAPNEEQ